MSEESRRAGEAGREEKEKTPEVGGTQSVRVGGGTGEPAHCICGGWCGGWIETSLTKKSTVRQDAGYGEAAAA